MPSPSSVRMTAWELRSERSAHQNDSGLPAQRDSIVCCSDELSSRRTNYSGTARRSPTAATTTPPTVAGPCVQRLETVIDPLEQRGLLGRGRDGHVHTATGQ